MLCSDAKSIKFAIATSAGGGPVLVAHSGHAKDKSDWQRLDAHLKAVARLAAGHAQQFGLGKAGRVGAGFGGGAVTTAGTKVCFTEVCLHASRRQTNTCCGLRPQRRAPSEMIAFGSSVSATIRALSSVDQ